MNTMLAMFSFEEDIHLVMLYTQLIAFVGYGLTLGGTMVYFLFSRKKVSTQEHALIVQNLHQAIETAVRWGFGLGLTTLLINSGIWFFGAAEIKELIEACLNVMFRFWLLEGLLSYVLSIILALTIKDTSECDKLCRAARRLAFFMIILGFVVMCLLAFLRC